MTVTNQEQEKGHYAVIGWWADDILEHYPHWTRSQAEDFLAEIEWELQVKMVDAGWDLIIFRAEDWERNPRIDYLQGVTEDQNRLDFGENRRKLNE
ncbi:MAG: hypothetical protein C4576_03300 [Desulfobacteraceae bacterium]|nr:MAG: hypothetical protein C4576_03300 [Desulfobacteraceae bacterium]